VASASEEVVALGEVRPLEVSDLPEASRTIARSFAWHEPWGEWAMPDESTREDRLAELIENDVRERFLLHGECWTIGGASTTLWIPPVGSAPGTEVFAARRSESEYPQYGDRADAMRAGDALIASLKPDRPYWYLDTIATAPELFGHGLAGRLLEHNLAIRDAAGDLCALDTHTPRQIAFYERFGFEVTGEGPLSDDLAVFMLLREPSGTAVK